MILRSIRLNLALSTTTSVSETTLDLPIGDPRAIG